MATTSKADHGHPAEAWWLLAAALVRDDTDRHADLGHTH